MQERGTAMMTENDKKELKKMRHTISLLYNYDLDAPKKAEKQKPVMQERTLMQELRMARLLCQI